MKELLWHGKHIDLVKVGHWEFADRPNISGIVAIAALTPEGEVLLVEQLRPPVGRAVIELPAGLAGDIAGSEKEALAEAAKRELLEETGYAAGEMVFLTEGPPSAGITSEVVTFFRAEKIVCHRAGGGDASEKITVHKVPLKDVEPWLQRHQQTGKLIDPKVYVGLYFLRSWQTSG